MRTLFAVLAVALVACVGPTEASGICYPIGTDTVGVVKRNSADGLVTQCIWLTNDKAICYPARPKNPTCFIGEKSF